jgi:hypothetical protein
MKTQRSRAWRQRQNALKKNRGMGTAPKFKPEKKWSNLYLRSNKLLRAKQLGFEYPRLGKKQFIEFHTNGEFGS